MTLIEKLNEHKETIAVLRGTEEQGSYEFIFLGHHLLGFQTAINIVKEHSDWISLDERLPEDNCYVLVYCCGGNIGKSFFTYNRKYLAKRDTFYSRKTHGKNSGYFAISHDEGYKVTHWQPLPNPPSEV